VVRRAVVVRNALQTVALFFVADCVIWAILGRFARGGRDANVVDAFVKRGAVGGDKALYALSALCVAQESFLARDCGATGGRALVLITAVADFAIIISDTFDAAILEADARLSTVAAVTTAAITSTLRTSALRNA